MAVGDFVGKFGSAGTGDGQFQNFTISISVNGNYIYTSEGNLSNSRVQIFNINSPYNFYDKINFSPYDPFDADIDDSYLYAITNVDSKLRIHNKTSPYAQIGIVSNIGGGVVWAPVSLSIDNNYIYITCVQQQRIEIYNKNSPWAKIGQFGSLGAGDGQFSFLGATTGTNGGIAIDSNYIYVADTGNHRIQIFDKNSPYSFIGKFGSFGAGDGQFSNPTGLTIDNSYIYVVDKGNYRIQYFSKNSPYSFIGKFGSLGAGDGQFNTPQKIKKYGDLLYVTDTVNTRVQIFQGQPSFIPGAQSGGGSGGGGASGRRLRARYTGRSLGR